MKDCAKFYGVSPAFALAVAEAESGKGNKRFRFGKVGRYHLPWGVHECFEKKWPVSDLYVQTEVAIKALARSKNQRMTLRKYNTDPDPRAWERYFRRIKALEAKNKKEKSDGS